MAISKPIPKTPAVKPIKAVAKGGKPPAKAPDKAISMAEKMAKLRAMRKK